MIKKIGSPEKISKAIKVTNEEDINKVSNVLDIEEKRKCLKKKN